MNDGPGREEEQRFEERMREQVEDAGGIGSNSAGHEHISKLRDGGVREDTLDVVLHHADGRGEDRCSGAHTGDYRERGGGVVEEDMAAGDHVDAGSNHGGGVNERGDGGGAFHRVGQPHVQRNLSGLARGAQDEQERDGRKKTNALPFGV